MTYYPVAIIGADSDELTADYELVNELVNAEFSLLY